MKKKIIKLVIIIGVLVLLIPIPFRLKDGGSIEFRALLYTITKYHRLSANPNEMYINGIGIKILGVEIFNNIKDKENNTSGIDEISTQGKVVITRDKITNIYLLDKFLDNTYKYNENPISNEVEIVTYTIEGDEIITKLEYNKEKDEFIVTRDNTKDEFASAEERKIETKTYSNEVYNIVKKIEANYIYIVLEEDININREMEITICGYHKDLEKNKDTTRTRLKELSVQDEEVFPEELVTYNGILYAKSKLMLDYEANVIRPLGIINKLIGEEYLPILDCETNTEKLLNAVINEADENSLVLIVDGEAVLYKAVENVAYSFFAKVIQSGEKYIIVEPVEGSNERKSSDKISIGLGENNDVIYPVGANVKITYDGMIMETYPAQINVIKIEII